MTARVRSFDVFDTSLTRLVGHPSSAFLLLGLRLANRGVWRLDAGQFADLRVQAEHRARVNSGRQEICLDDIYSEFGHASNCTRAELEQMMEAEIELEELLLVPVPGTQARLDCSRNEGATILFVSDTYHSGAILKRWLERHGLYRSGDRIWASCDTGTTKASGALYRDLVQHEGLRARDVHHFGDNKEVDERGARDAGMRSEWFKAGCLTAKECLMEQHARSTAGAASLMAGASRYVRLAALATRESGDQGTLRRIAAETAGPVLTSFLVWALQRCSALGVRSVLFAARDGQVLMRMAKPIASKLGLEFDMQYVYANRQLVNLAGLRALDDDALDWITAGAAMTSFKEFLQRVGLTLADVGDESPQLVLPVDGPVGFANLGALRAFMLRESVASRILASASLRRNQVVDYFSTVGLLGDVPCAIVDIGWRGRVFKSIASAIGVDAADKHVALYFGLVERPDPLPPGRQEAYLFDKQGSLSVGGGHRMEGLTAALEVFTQATHGQVLGIERHHDGFRPVLASASNDVGPVWDVPYFQDRLVEFAEAIAVDGCVARAGGDLRPMCRDLLQTLLRAPTPDEARVFGSFCFTDGPNDAASKPLAVPLTVSDVWATFRHRRLPNKTYNWWQDGALMLTRPSTRMILDVALRLAKRRPSLRSMIKRMRRQTTGE